MGGFDHCLVPNQCFRLACQCLNKWQRHQCGSWDEPTVEIGRTDKLLQALDGHWLAEPCDGIHFIWQWYDTSASDSMAEEVNGIMTRLALGDIDDQAILTKSLEEQAKVFFVHRGVFTSYQDVINVDKSKNLSP